MRVVAPDIGGSFGMKSAIYNEVPLVLLGSKKIGRPVKWMSTRSEAFLSDAQARDNVTDAELALDKDGTFLAFRVSSSVNAGAYLQSGFQAYTGNLGTLAGVYRTPAMYVESTAVFTHTQPMRPYRGNGRPEAAYVIERMVDVAAAQLKMDPAELRRKNYIPPEAMPFKTSLTFTYDSGEFEKGMDLALKMADWDGFAKRKAESKKNGKLRGLGMSNTIERAAAPSLEGAEIRFDRGGTVQIFSGSINQGQGHETTFKQVVADKLGIHPNDIEYIQGDTDKVFFGEGTGGSRSATMSGSAFYMAGEKVIAKAKAIAAHNLKVDVADVKFDEGIFSSAKTNQTITIKDVAQDAVNPAKLPKNMEAGLFATAVYKADVENFPNGVHVCEVEVDPETGKVEVVKYNVVDDVGTVMNPLLLKGQIVGGVAMGVGQILKEDINFDDGGQLTTGSFMDYAMPRAHDFPLDRGEGQSGADQDQSARRQGRGRSRLRRRDAGGGERAGRCARGVRRAPHRDAGDAGGGVAGDRTTGRQDKNNDDSRRNQGKDDLGRQGAGQRRPGRLHARPHLVPAAGQSEAVLHEVPQHRPRRDHAGEHPDHRSRRQGRGRHHAPPQRGLHPFGDLQGAAGRALHPAHPPALFDRAVGQRAAAQGDEPAGRAVPQRDRDLHRHHQPDPHATRWAQAWRAMLGPHSVVMLKNHGIVTAAPTIDEVVIRTIMFENAAQIQMIAEAAGDVCAGVPATPTSSSSSTTSAGRTSSR